MKTKKPIRNRLIPQVLAWLGLVAPVIGQSSGDMRAWISIGPRPIPGMGAWGTVNGRVRAVAVDPANLNHWLIGAASGGVWETHDAGTHWSPRTDDQPALQMGAVAFAPSNPQIVYAGTGEESQSEGAGILKSTDGGSHWVLLAPETFLHTACTVIRVDPTNPNTLLAGTTAGEIWPQSIVTEYGQFLPFAPPMGIQRSVDGGMSWSLTLAGQATDLAVDPANFNRQYAALGGMFGTITNGLLISTNGLYRSIDVGQTWTLVPGPWNSLPRPAGRVQLALAPSDPNVLYVSMAIAFPPYVGLSPQPQIAGTSLGLWRTTNAWATTPNWSQLPDPGDVGDQLWYDHFIIVDPIDPGVLFFGSEVLKKFNGVAWQTLPNVIHGDQQCAAWAGSRLIVGNDGGVYSSTDRGNTWNNHNTDLAITQFYFGVLHPNNAGFAVTGSQDIGFVAWTGNMAWTFLEGGDGVAGVLSPTHPDTHMASLSPYGDVFRELNGPASYAEATNGLDLTDAPGLSRLIMHSTNEDLLLLGTDRIWKCTNCFSASTPTWYANSPVRSSTASVRGSVTAVSFGKSDPSGNTYAYGNRYGELYLTTDGGATWHDLDPSNAVPDRCVCAVAFDSADANVLYAALSSYDELTPGHPGHFFLTTNALAGAPAWIDVSPPANVPHFSIATDPDAHNTVYVGTYRGVWATTDRGASWQHLGPEMGMPNVPVFDLQFQRSTGRLFAFTYGRGAFVLAPRPLLSTPEILADGSTRIRVQSQPNQRYAVDVSTNLSDWAQLSTFTATNDSMSVADRANPAASRRFYRGRLLIP